MVIAILNPKGGCGKSTLATNLARAFQLEGRSVIILDTDPHGTVREWHSRHLNPSARAPVVSVDARQLSHDLKDLTDGYQVAIIDGTAKAMQGLGLATKVADFVLVPVQPTAADLWAVGGLAELILTRQRIKRGSPIAAFVLVRHVRGSRKLAELVEASLKAYQLPVLKSRIGQRMVYAEALGEGSTVLDMEPGGKAAEEVKRVMKEIVAVYDGIRAYAPREVLHAAVPGYEPRPRAAPRGEHAVVPEAPGLPEVHGSIDDPFPYTITQITEPNDWAGESGDGAADDPAL